MLMASLLFGISASLDALLVGISFGLRGVRIRLWQNLTISLVHHERVLVWEHGGNRLILSSCT